MTTVSEISPTNGRTPQESEERLSDSLDGNTTAMDRADANHKTAQESAERLATSLDNNTTALSRLRKRYRLLLVLIAVVALSLAAVVRVNYDVTVRQCRTGNELRFEENEKWQSISEFLENFAGENITEGEQAFVDLLAADLEPRDCSDINWLGK